MTLMFSFICTLSVRDRAIHYSEKIYIYIGSYNCFIIL
jgi:hypothetical protein